MNKTKLLTNEQMAEFTSKGFLVFDSLIPEEINKRFLDDIGDTTTEPTENINDHYNKIMQSSSIPIVKAGTPLKYSYPKESALNKIISHPVVDGAITSLVGSDCIVDHHFLHITFPSKYFVTPKLKLSKSFKVEFSYALFRLFVNSGSADSNLRSIPKLFLNIYPNCTL